MVLPAPNADDLQARWIKRIVGIFGLASKGVLVLVPDAKPAQLAPLMRALRQQVSPDARLINHTDDLREARDKALVVVAVRDVDSEWLNHYRPIFERKKLRAIIWSDEAVTPTLLAGAPDFSDWISHFLQCPFTVPSFTRRGLALGRSWHPGIVWRGGLALDAVLDHLGHSHVEGPSDKDLPYPSWVEFLRDCEAEFVRIRGASSNVALRRLRWALAQTQFPGTVVLDEPEVEVPGWFPVHARQRSVFEVEPGALELAITLDFEPEALAHATHAHGLEPLVGRELEPAELDAALVAVLRESPDHHARLDAALRLRQPGPVVRELFDHGRELRAEAEALAAPTVEGTTHLGREELTLLPGLAKRGIHPALDELLVEGLSSDELTGVKVELELLRGSVRALAESYLIREVQASDPQAWDYFAKFAGTESALIQRLSPFELRAYILARGAVLGWDALQVQRLAITAIEHTQAPLELATTISEAATQQLGPKTPAHAELSFSLAAALAIHHELGMATPWVERAAAATGQLQDILAGLDLFEGRVAQGHERLEALVGANGPRGARIPELLTLAQRMMGAGPEPDQAASERAATAQPRALLERILRAAFEDRLRALERSEVNLPVKLRQALTRGELILCVGPELSAMAGLPSTQDLAERLLELSESSSATRPRRTGIELGTEVEQELDDADVDVPELAFAIATLAPQLRAVYTTQLDTLLERAFRGRWPVYASARADLARRTKAIIKLFGTVTSRPSWVLTPEQFEREFAPEAPRHTLFTTAFRAHHMLFVGFEPDSEELERLLGLVPVDTEAGPPSHFLIAPSVEPDDREQLRRRGLSAVVGEPELLLRSLTETDALVRSGSSIIAMIADGSCPYPGLGGFREASAGLFFGRHLEISEATQRLGATRSRRWLFIEGPSGVGKSSFVHAGIVPALREGFAADIAREWVVARLRPGQRPLDNLGHALRRALPEAKAEPPLSAETLDDWLRPEIPEGAAMLIVVDQLEELVTTATLDQRERFDRVLAALLDAGLVYLVTTVRADFVPAIQRELLELGARLNDQATRYALAPLGRQGLRQAVIEPARRSGLELGLGLVEYIVDDAEQFAIRSRRDARSKGALEAIDALPLVAHTLERLWAAASEDERIELDDYRALEGLGRALDASAEQAFAELDADEQHRAETLLRGLILVHSGAPMARGLSREEAIVLAGGGERGESLLAKLTSTGPHAAASSLRGQPRDFALLRVDLDSREQRVDLTHDALLGGWERLRAWSAEERRQHLYDQELSRRASIWAERGRPKRGLPRGDEFSLLLRARPGGQHHELQTEYQAVLRWSRRRRMIGLALVALWLVGTSATLAAVRLRDARRAHDEEQAVAQVKRNKIDFERSIAELRIAEFEVRTRISEAKRVTSEKIQARIKDLQDRNGARIAQLEAARKALVEEHERTGKLSVEQARKLESTEAKLKKAERAGGDLERAIKVANKEQERLESEVADFENKVRDFRQKVADLTSSNAELEQALKTMETALSEAQTSLSETQAQLAGAQQDLTDKDSRLEELDASVQSHVDEIEALKARIAELEAELAPAGQEPIDDEYTLTP